MRRASLSMAVILPLLLLTLLLLVFNTPAHNRAEEVEQLQPVKAAQLATLPEGSRVTLEGVIDKSSVTKFQSLVAYFRDERYLDVDLSGQWGTVEHAAASFVLNVPDGQVRVINTSYDLQNPSTYLDMGLVRYRGLALGDLVTVIGTVVQTPQGPALEAQLVSGGSRADFIATNNQLTVPLTTLAVFALALLLIMIAAIIIIRNRQSQSHAAA